MKIEVFDGPVEGRHVSVSSLTINGAPVTVGRSQTADLSITDRWVSRRHCLLYQSDGGYAVCDLGSRHGTFLNGKRITQAELKPGDEIRIGLSSLVLSNEPLPRPKMNGADAAQASLVGAPSSDRPPSSWSQSVGESSQTVVAISPRRRSRSAGP